MTGLQFVASVISSMSWPLVVITVVLVFRKKLSDLIGDRLSRVKWKDFEAEWDHTVIEAEEKLESLSADESRDQAGPQEPPHDLSEELRRAWAALDLSPRMAVAEAAIVLEGRLASTVSLYHFSERDRQLLLRRGLRSLADAGFKQGEITKELYELIYDLSRLRNLAVHAGSEEISRAQAEQYIRLTASALEQLP